MLSSVVLLVSSGCTYGPVEERAMVVQIVRLGDSYRAVAVIRRDVFQRPTGLSTFPDGGRWRFVERHASQLLLDAEARQAVRLASQQASDSLWESFDAHIAGLVGDSVVYLVLTGCPRSGECHPALTNREVLRLSPREDARPADRVPTNAVLPGTMLARAPGEQSYIRFGTSADTITARVEEDGPYRPLFLVSKDGDVKVIGRS